MSFSWQGASGRWYEMDVVRAKRAWDATGGVYMFVKPGDGHMMEAGGPVSLYVASTHSFEEALSRHEMWQPAQQLGAAEIHLIAVADDALRAKVEKDLLDAQTPILNRQMLRRVA